MPELSLEAANALESPVLVKGNLISIRNRTPALREGLIAGRRLVESGPILKPRLEIPEIGSAESPPPPLALQSQVVFLHGSEVEVRINGTIGYGRWVKRRSSPEPGKRIRKTNGRREKSILAQ